MTEDQKELKKLCLKHIVRYRKAIRIYTLHHQKQLNKTKHCHRLVRLFERKIDQLQGAEGFQTSFCRDRIRVAKAEAARADSLANDYESEIVRFAEFIETWLAGYDPLSNLNEKAAILATSETAILKKLFEFGPPKDDPEKIPLYELVMVHHGEWQPRRGERDCVPPDRTRMPLFWAFLELDRHRRETIPEYREVTNQAFSDFFTDRPQLKLVKTEQPTFLN